MLFPGTRPPASLATRLAALPQSARMAVDSRHDISPAGVCCAGIGTRSIYSIGRLQAFYRSEESRRYHLAGLKQLERDWVQHQRQIPGNNIIWGWPQRWYRRISRPAS